MVLRGRKNDRKMHLPDNFSAEHAPNASNAPARNDANYGFCPFLSEFACKLGVAHVCLQEPLIHNLKTTLTLSSSSDLDALDASGALL
jgi:hypothetical protein